MLTLSNILVAVFRILRLGSVAGPHSSLMNVKPGWVGVKAD